jgi:hypothetical protein
MSEPATIRLEDGLLTALRRRLPDARAIEDLRLLSGGAS